MAKWILLREKRWWTVAVSRVSFQAQCNFFFSKEATKRKSVAALTWWPAKTAIQTAVAGVTGNRSLLLLRRLAVKNPTRLCDWVGSFCEHRGRTRRAGAFCLLPRRVPNHKTDAQEHLFAWSRRFFEVVHRAWTSGEVCSWRHALFHGWRQF